ncbi:MAG: hypothetical protein BWY57_02309 [Betaproteobacteria bacterium ADurb.Bin341]|nr:MAG: hypothetical protein BWY57_02309 [Betaproteobacteria bacterium ADurb.Bin341]
MRTANRVAGLDAEFRFQRCQEALEKGHAEGVGRLHDGGNLRVDQCCEHEGTQAIGPAAFVDAGDDGVRLVGTVDERGAVLAEFDILELGQQAVAQGFGSQAGAVGDKEDGAFGFGHVQFRWRRRAAI